MDRTCADGRDADSEMCGFSSSASVGSGCCALPIRGETRTRNVKVTRVSARFCFFCCLCAPQKKFRTTAITGTVKTQGAKPISVVT